MIWKPIDIARKLGISTSSLRHYERWGMLPPVERTPSGYRIYREEHVACFACIRGMADGFGIRLTSVILEALRSRRVEDAFRLVNEAQAALHREYILSDKTMKSLRQQDDRWMKERGSGALSMREVSDATGIPATTIRHWEKAGLLHVPRNEANGYRKFGRSHVRRILIIQALKSTAYAQTYSIGGIRESLDRLDENDVEGLGLIASEYQACLDRLNQHQMRGIHHLCDLCGTLGLLL